MDVLGPLASGHLKRKPVINDLQPVKSAGLIAH